MKYDIELLKKVHKPGGNTILSPLSIDLCTAMVAYAIPGNYALSESTALGKYKCCEDYRDLIVRLINKKGNQLKIANSLWGGWTHPYIESFVFEDSFFADIYPEASAQAINTWVNEKTEGLIPHTVDSIPPKSNIFINALYFKGDWLKPFFEGTAPAPFYGSGGESTVSTMFRKCSFGFYEDGDVLNVKLDYTGGQRRNFAFLISMPKAKPIDQYIKENLEAEDYKKWGHQPLKLYLPKFTLESTVDIQEALGVEIKGAVSAKSTAKMEVNEEGTEAAALSKVIVMCCGMGPLSTIEVKINRPFIFRLIDQMTDTVIFNGAINNL